MIRAYFGWKKVLNYKGNNCCFQKSRLFTIINYYCSFLRLHENKLTTVVIIVHFSVPIKLYRSLNLNSNLTFDSFLRIITKKIQMKNTRLTCLTIQIFWRICSILAKKMLKKRKKTDVQHQTNS